MRGALKRKNELITLLVTTILIVAATFSAKIFSADYNITTASQTIPFITNGAATNGKVIVVSGTNGAIQVFDLKTHKLLLDSRTTGKSYELSSLIYDSKRFIGIQNKNFIGISTDGTQWSFKKINADLKSIYYMDKVYIGISDNGLYQSNDLENFKEIYKFSGDNAFYKVVKVDKSYYAFSADSKSNNSETIWASNDLINWKAVKKYFGCIPQDIIQIDKKIYIPLVNTQKSVGDFSVIENGIVKNYFLHDAKDNSKDMPSTSGLLTIFEANNKLSAVTNDGLLISINKDFSYLSQQKFIYPSTGKYICTVRTSSEVMFATENNIINMNPEGYTNCIISVDNPRITNLIYNGKEYIAYNQFEYQSEAFRYYITKDLINWRYVNLPIKGVSGFASGNDRSIFCFYDKLQLLMLKDNHYTNINIKFPDDLGDKRYIRIISVNYADKKFQIKVNNKNGFSYFESVDGIKWVVRPKNEESYLNIKYTGLIVGTGKYNGKQTYVCYNYASKNKQYITFYQSDNDQKWTDAGTVNIYNPKITIMKNLLLEGATFAKNKVLLTGLGNYIYEIDNLKTVKYINTSEYTKLENNDNIGVGIERSNGNFIFPTTKGIIELKIGDASDESSDGKGTNQIDIYEKKIKEFVEANKNAVPIYLDKDRIIYSLDNFVYVKELGKIKKLFEKQGSLYYSNSANVSGNISNDPNEYYYEKTNNSFMDGSKIYFVGKDGLYCFDTKNGGFNKLISDDMGIYYINLDGDKDYSLSDMYDDKDSNEYDGYNCSNERSGYLSNYKEKMFTYINSTNDVKQFDLSTGKEEVLIPSDKLPYDFDKVFINPSVIFCYDNYVYIKTSYKTGQWQCKVLLYIYNRKTGEIDVKSLRDDG